LASSSRIRVIKDIKRLFDRVFVRHVEDHPMAAPSMDDDDAHDLGHIFDRDSSPARIRYGGIIYARSSTHQGNSQIMFYAHGDSRELPKPGVIEKISCKAREPAQLHVRPFLPPANLCRDPFALWPLLRAQMWSQKLGPSMIVELEWIHSQLISCELEDDRQAIIPVSHVSDSPTIHLRSSL
jgi:hypothetical protein